MKSEKIVIYQLLPRLFGNKNTKVVVDGSREDNGTGKFSDINNVALKEIKSMGVSHIWFTGIIEHAIVKGYPDNKIPDGNPVVIKGKAGSPYAIKDYYDVNPDLADNVGERICEFKSLLQRTHANGLKAIIDFVPNHLAREYYSDMKPSGITDFGVSDDIQKSFSPSNNFYYLPNERLQLPTEITNNFPYVDYEEYPAKVTGNDHFTSSLGANDWYETVKLNYGVDYMVGKASFFDPVPDTWIKMRDVLLYWAEMEIDGFRCDMAEMVPVEFWEWVIPKVKQANPEIIFIAEVYNPQLYTSYINKGKFDYLYDKVGLYDTLRGIMLNEKPASDISLSWQALDGLDKHMLRFLENHDEQRIASQYFVGDPIKAVPGMVVSTCMHQGPVMVYSGQEVGEPASGVSGFSGDDGRTTIFDYWNIPYHQLWMNNGKFDGGLLSDEQKQLRNTYIDILHLAKLPAVQYGLFYDIMWHNNHQEINKNKVFAFIRYTDKQKLLIVCNFDSQKQKINLKVPPHAIEVMDIPRPIIIYLNDVGKRFECKISSEEFIEEGVKMVIEPYRYYVLEMGY